MRRCATPECRQALPALRRCPTCAACMRAYMRQRRARERAARVAAQGAYCGTCGCPVTGPCCAGAGVVPVVRWEAWAPGAARVGRLLQAAPGDGIMAAAAVTRQTGLTPAQLRRWGCPLGTPGGACQSPYLYTDNALGLLLFLTPRARATPSPSRTGPAGR